MKQRLWAAMLLLFVVPAHAEYTVKGSVNCPDVVNEDSNEHYREYNRWWLLGYLSARNYAVDLLGADGLVGKNVEADEIYAMGLSFCEANADKTWDDAAIHVYELLE
ncbi:MAG: hypothetical protein AB8B85_18935 [Paracoccaceae bacterium]